MVNELSIDELSKLASETLARLPEVCEKVDMSCNSLRDCSAKWHKAKWKRTPSTLIRQPVRAKGGQSVETLAEATEDHNFEKVTFAKAAED